MIKISKFDRKPLRVEGVQVTAENMAEVAEWCGGEVLEHTYMGNQESYIKVPVVHPVSERQTRATIGTWVLLSEKGFKVYTKRSFNTSFEEVDSVQNIFDSEEKSEDTSDKKIEIRFVSDNPNLEDSFFLDQWDEESVSFIARSIVDRLASESVEVNVSDVISFLKDLAPSGGVSIVDIDRIKRLDRSNS